MIRYLRDEKELNKKLTISKPLRIMTVRFPMFLTTFWTDRVPKKVPENHSGIHLSRSNAELA